MLTSTIYSVRLNVSVVFQNNVEPMVIDMAVEENDNTEEEPVIVESTSLVGVVLSLTMLRMFMPLPWIFQ